MPPLQQEPVYWLPARFQGDRWTAFVDFPQRKVRHGELGAKHHQHSLQLKGSEMFAFPKPGIEDAVYKSTSSRTNQTCYALVRIEGHLFLTPIRNYYKMEVLHTDIENVDWLGDAIVRDLEEERLKQEVKQESIDRINQEHFGIVPDEGPAPDFDFDAEFSDDDGDIVAPSYETIVSESEDEFSSDEEPEEPKPQRRTAADVPDIMDSEPPRRLARKSGLGGEAGITDALKRTIIHFVRGKGTRGATPEVILRHATISRSVKELQAVNPSFNLFGFMDSFAYVRFGSWFIRKKERTSSSSQ